MKILNWVLKVAAKNVEKLLTSPMLWKPFRWAISCASWLSTLLWNRTRNELVKSSPDGLEATAVDNKTTLVRPSKREHHDFGILGTISLLFHYFLRFLFSSDFSTFLKKFSMNFPPLYFPALWMCWWKNFLLLIFHFFDFSN